MSQPLPKFSFWNRFSHLFQNSSKKIKAFWHFCSSLSLFYSFPHTYFFYKVDTLLFSSFSPLDLSILHHLLKLTASRLFFQYWWISPNMTCASISISSKCSSRFAWRWVKRQIKPAFFTAAVDCSPSPLPPCASHAFLFCLFNSVFC